MGLMDLSVWKFFHETLCSERWQEKNSSIFSFECHNVFARHRFGVGYNTTQD